MFWSTYTACRKFSAISLKNVAPSCQEGQALEEVALVVVPGGLWKLENVLVSKMVSNYLQIQGVCNKSDKAENIWSLWTNKSCNVVKTYLLVW